MANDAMTQQLMARGTMLIACLDVPDVEGIGTCHVAMHVQQQPLLASKCAALCPAILTSRAKGSFLISNSVLFWNLRISMSARVPGL